MHYLSERTRLPLHKKKRKYRKPPINPVNPHELPWTNNYHYHVSHFAAREGVSMTMAQQVLHGLHEYWAPGETYENFLKNWLQGTRDKNMQNKGIEHKPGEDTSRDAAIKRQDAAQNQGKPVKLKDIE